MKRVFITGTWRIEWNKDYNPKLADALESKGFSCYLPQRDSEQKGNRKVTFQEDIDGIKNCDIIVAVGANSQTANWGFELGYAYGINMPAIILTDKRDEVHLMPEGGAQEILVPDNINDLNNYIDELVSLIQKYI